MYFAGQSLSKDRKINSYSLGQNQLIEFSDEAREGLFSPNSLNNDLHRIYLCNT